MPQALQDKADKQIQAVAAKLRELLKRRVPIKLIVNIGHGTIHSSYTENRDYVIRE